MYKTVKEKIEDYETNGKGLFVGSLILKNE
jgi:hypothetical protein